MVYDPDEEQEAAYRLCAGLYGECLCQSRRDRPCDWMTNEVMNGTTVADAEREMSVCRDVMNEEPW